MQHNLLNVQIRNSNPPTYTHTCIDSHVCALVRLQYNQTPPKAVVFSFRKGNAGSNGLVEAPAKTKRRWQYLLTFISLNIWLRARTIGWLTKHCCWWWWRGTTGSRMNLWLFLVCVCVRVICCEWWQENDKICHTTENWKCQKRESKGNSFPPPTPLCWTF